MRFTSTRSADEAVGLSHAIERGLAPDGGLYVPERIPTLDPDRLLGDGDLATVARVVLQPFFAGDPLESHLASIAERAFTFPAPLVRLNDAPTAASVLELFHGPTCAFKDFGARFLSACLERIHRGSGKVTILVATSGDTGAAVASAFHQAPFADVVVLYPKGLVSPRQAHQLACWGGNVRTFAVHGTFDDCQRLVKDAFQDPALNASMTLSSANSINIGRLLPQVVYYAQASLRIWHDEQRRPDFIVPTGNLGNAMACILAREMGLPVGRIVLATNANRPIPDYLASGVWQPRASVATLASAMDVGSPSNMERVRWLWPDVEQIRRQLDAFVVSDEEIRATIVRDADSIGHVWCPHTATAAHVYRQVAGRDDNAHWVLVSTAHPAKFDEIVEPLIARPVAVPDSLQRLLERPIAEEALAPDLDALRDRLLTSEGTC